MRKVRVWDIDWDVREEDVRDQDEMEQVLKDLPTTVLLDVPEYDDVDFDADEGMLEEAINELLSDKYGWLINGYYYEEVK